MAYRIEFSRQARRHFDDLPARIKARIAPRIDALAENPRSPGCQHLAGPDDLYRIRVGDYRAIYRIEDDILHVLVVRIGHRREIYR
ncbi:MAG: type II toxin-antitoxin system RelE family toxin [Thermomicrobiales bacterium]